MQPFIDPGLILPGQVRVTTHTNDVGIGIDCLAQAASITGNHHIRGTKIIILPSPAAKTQYAIRKTCVRDSDFCNRNSSKFAKNLIFLEFLCRKCGFWAPKTRPNENASYFQQDPCRKPETAEGRSPVAVSGFRQGSISNYHISPYKPAFPRWKTHSVSSQMYVADAWPSI